MKKKLVIVLAIFIMLNSVVTPIGAVDLTNNEKIDSEVISVFCDDYDVDIIVERCHDEITHTITFRDLISENGSTMMTIGDEIDSQVTTLNAKNLDVLTKYFDTINLSKKEQQKHLDFLEASIFGGYLESYTIYTTTDARSTYSDYGTYSGVNFYCKDGGTASVLYKKEQNRNVAELNKWINGTMNLVLLMESMAPVSYAITMWDVGKSMFDSHYSAQSGDVADYCIRAVTRMREIGIIDVWGDFKTVMVDSLVDLYPYIVYHYADPEVQGISAAVFEQSVLYRRMPSQYYENTTYNCRAAYTQYTTKPDLILYMQGVSLNDSLFDWLWEEQ